MAHLILWASLFSFSMAVIVAFISKDIETLNVATERYFGSGKIGKYIDRGFYGILISVALGILVEISANLQKMTDAKKRPD